MRHFGKIKTGICVSMVITFAAMADTPAPINTQAAGDPQTHHPAPTSRDVRRLEAAYVIPAAPTTCSCSKFA